MYLARGAENCKQCQGSKIHEEGRPGGICTAQERRKVGLSLGGAGHCQHIPKTPVRLHPCLLFLLACPGRSLVPSPQPVPSSPAQGPPPKCGVEGAAQLLGRSWGSTKLWCKAPDRFNPRRTACLQAGSSPGRGKHQCWWHSCLPAHPRAAPVQPTRGYHRVHA